MDDEKTLRPHFSPQHPPAALPKLSVHSGQGNLRGGGVRAVYGQSRTQKLVLKLERRLGLCLALCMAILLTALVIHGLFHEPVRAALSELIDGTEREMRDMQQHDIVALSDSVGSTTVVDGVAGGDNSSATESSEVPPMLPRIRTESDQLIELNDFRQRFARADNQLWTLVLLNLLGLVLLVPGTCLYWAMTSGRRGDAAADGGGSCRMAYRALLILVALLLIVQLILLLLLFINSIEFPYIVDKLFNNYLPLFPEGKRADLAEPIEDKFSCKVKVEHELLKQLRLQEECVPRLKDGLLAPYIVFFLILVTIFPFLFAVFICLWPTKIKNLPPIERARKRIELNQSERRPQSREQILKRATDMETNGAKIH